jgi:O-antigen biosynthesis protein
VIPAYDQLAYTRICLASLELDGDGRSEVVVVDNGSTDGTREFLAAWAAGGPRRKVVAPGENLGFAGGCNLGAAAATGRFLVFLNNDTFVLPGWLDCLLQPFSDRSVKVAGPLLLYPNGRVQHAGLAFDERGPHHLFAGLRADHPAVTRPRDCQAVTGAALAIRAADFQRLGGFDESFRNSFEDVDLCLRVRQEGGRIVYVPGSVAYHFESVSEGRLGPRDRSNYDRFIERWRGRYELDLRPAMQAEDMTDRVPPKVELLHALRESERHVKRLEDELEEYREVLRLSPVRLALEARRRLGKGLPAAVAAWLRWDLPPDEPGGAGASERPS